MIIHISTSFLAHSIFVSLDAPFYLMFFARAVPIRDSGATFPTTLRKIRCRRKTAESASEIRENNKGTSWFALVEDVIDFTHAAP